MITHEPGDGEEDDIENVKFIVRVGEPNFNFDPVGVDVVLVIR